MVETGEVVAKVTDLGGKLGHVFEAGDGVVDFADGALNVEEGPAVGGGAAVAGGLNLGPSRRRGGWDVGVDGREDFHARALESLPEAPVAMLTLVEDDGLGA